MDHHQKTANTSGLVNGSGPIVWTINVVKDTANVGTFAVKGSITIQNTGGAPADIGNIVISLQKPNSQKIGGKLVPWVSVAADVADATSGDAATSAKIVGEGSSESQPFNAAYGAGNYTASGVQGTFTETSGSGSLAFTDASNMPFSLTPQVSLAPGATLTLLYTAGFDINALGLAPGTSLRVEALVSFGNAGARGGSGAAVANIDINGNGVIDSNEGPAPAKVRTVPCRVTRVLSAAGNDSVTLSDMPSDVVATGAGITFNNFATDMGGGTGTEVINGSVTRTVSVNVSCSGTSAGNIVNRAHLDGAASACVAALDLDAVSTVPISCSTGGQGGFRNGEFCTGTQADWGDATTDAGTLLQQYFNSLYGTLGYVEVGIPGFGYSMLFTSAGAVFTYLPSSGPPAPLNADLIDPTATASGVFGGEVLALRFNVDFNEAGLLQGAGGSFARLVLCHFAAGDPILGAALTQAQADALNGQTVAQVLAEAEAVLGGDNGTYGLTIVQHSVLAGTLNSSFFDQRDENGVVIQECVPSPFAQAHLCRPTFQPGEFCTYSQADWGDGQSPTAPILENNFGTIYFSSGGVLIGLVPVFNMTFDSAQAIYDYMPATGAPAPLNANLSNPSTSASGSFGGEVLALQLNVDFNNAGLLGGTGSSFANLRLCNLAEGNSPVGPLTQAQADGLNGQTVAQVLAEANTVLGGGAGTYGLSTVQLNAVVVVLNASFGGCDVSSFAQAHLCRPTFQAGEFCTYNQDSWGTLGTAAATLLEANFFGVYTNGYVEIGIPGVAGYSAIFSPHNAVLNLLPTTGVPGPFGNDSSNPTSTSAGVLAGFVLALRLDVDFNAVGLLSGTGGQFAGLVLCKFSAGDPGGISVGNRTVDASSG